MYTLHVIVVCHVQNVKKMQEKKFRKVQITCWPKITTKCFDWLQVANVHCQHQFYSWFLNITNIIFGISRFNSACQINVIVKEQFGLDLVSLHLAFNTPQNSHEAWLIEGQNLLEIRIYRTYKHFPIDILTDNYSLTKSDIFVSCTLNVQFILCNILILLKIFLSSFNTKNIVSLEN